MENKNLIECIKAIGPIAEKYGMSEEDFKQVCEHIGKAFATAKLEEISSQYPDQPEEVPQEMPQDDLEGLLGGR